MRLVPTGVLVAGFTAPDLSPRPDRLRRKLAELLPPERPGPSVRLAHALGWANLVYLGLLPAAATFWVVFRHGSPGLLGLGENARALIGLAGFVAVAVEAAVLVTYTRLPSSLWGALLILFDGPVIALLSASSAQGLADVAVQAFLIDGTAVWLAIGALALAAEGLDARARLFSLGLMVVVLAPLAALFRPYLAQDLPHTGRAILPLLGGVIWGTVVNYRVLDADRVARDGGSGPVGACILVSSLGWLVAYGVGVALHP